ncbi:MAG: bifunctional (p)ppGpp synthetase/guanosine-3',5'-bis(diphosphate) 3'-pyrophosphohydrolase [Christensenellaceae bacterium]|jgi:GTP pyrophosphokinase|nr:bifunctional (p)ppGpp synthetase/guanosine-3',5'-bis(diphosphate) 3'-pyrophosphohydrolase [Christensenellaceae bacterium]
MAMQEILSKKLGLLFETIRRNGQEVDEARVYEACEYASRMHGDQRRESGEPYMIHPIEVATILADMQMDQVTICAALLHDALEDTKADFADIETLFGKDVAVLVDGVTKLSHVEFRSKDRQRAESLKKMFFAMAKDVRVVIIKLADRLHNMRTLKFMEEHKRLRIANETMEVYAPLAHRLGIYTIKWELEDLSFRYIDPEAYYELADSVAMKRDERMKAIEGIIKKLGEAFGQAGIKAEISGRPKHLYSIYKKMQSRGLAFNQVYDLIAVRVLVDTKEDCYSALGIVHTLWRPLPGRFKDYIAMPKPNGYQSLHNTLVGEGGVPFETQIRTHEMHRVAEYGVAAHWKYKEGVTESGKFDEQLSFLRQLISMENEMDDAQEFMDIIKSELLSDDVFVFSPKGDAVDLPNGSTPLDFAYRIHSQVGNRCVGAKVNQRIVTLDTKLQTGDIVEIITSSSSKGPSMDWLKIVKTTEAKSKIKAALKSNLREQNVSIGLEMIEREIKRQSYEASKLMRPEFFEKIIRRYSLKSAEDIYAAVGFGGLSSQAVVTRLADEWKRGQKPEEEPEIALARPKAQPKTGTNKQAVFVKGEDGMLVRFANCCHPVPGDEIVGYITRGRGVSVHRRDCVSLRDVSIETERLVDVEWNLGAENAYSVDLQLIVQGRRGEVSMWLTSIANDMKIPLLKMNVNDKRSRATTVDLTIEIKNAEQLEEMMRRINRNSNVIQAYRVSA